MDAPRRPTIADIAARAGVSPGAVSFALNNRPGVSDATRARIRDIAREMHWRPHSAARALGEVQTKLDEAEDRWLELEILREELSGSD